MNDRDRAEEDLRVIRALIERATTYRAISVPTALLGGVIALLSAVFIHLSSSPDSPLQRAVRPREFAWIWLSALCVTLIANALFIWREARASGRPFVSSGMKLALRAIAPNLIVPALFTIWFLRIGYLGGNELQLVVIWVVFYGLALLSTALFAPRSLTILGWAAFLTGLCVPALANVLEDFSREATNMVMGITFGLYHLIYALAVWASSRAGAVSGLTEE